VPFYNNQVLNQYKIEFVFEFSFEYFVISDKFFESGVGQIKMNRNWSKKCSFSLKNSLLFCQLKKMLQCRFDIGFSLESFVKRSSE
jgi:hypothetical protein